MDGDSKLLVEAYLQRMQDKTEALLRGVAEAVNAAPDGAWINGSEMQVRDLFADLRQEAYETALQMRLDVKQAAFSPGEPGGRSAAAEQGSGQPQHADGQRAGGTHS
jgi:hypothetical protein